MALLGLLSFIALLSAVISLLIIGPAKDRLRALRREGKVPAFTGNTLKWVRAHPKEWKEIAAKELPAFQVFAFLFFAIGGVVAVMTLVFVVNGAGSERAGRDSRFTPQEERMIWHQAEENYRARGGR